MAAQPISAAQEVAPRDGLRGALGVGVFLPDTDPLDPQSRWAGPNGYTLEGEPCGDVTYSRNIDFCTDEPLTDVVWDPEAADFDPAVPGPMVGTLADQHPFLVGAAIRCSTMGTSFGDLVARFQGVADRALELRLWPGIANELWTGVRATASGFTNRYLADADATVLNGGTAVPLVEAIATLEDEFALCSPGDQQVIHVPRKFVAYLDWKNLLPTTVGTGRLYTGNGSLIVADRGYPGTGPAGDPDEAVTATTAWAYSTGILSARLGPVVHPERQLQDAVTAGTNTAQVRAERQAAISWLCCHLAVNVEYGA